MGGLASCPGRKWESGERSPEPPQIHPNDMVLTDTCMGKQPTRQAVEMRAPSQLECCTVPRFPNLPQEGVELLELSASQTFTPKSLSQLRRMNMTPRGSGRCPKTWPQAHFFEVFCVVFKLARIPHFHSLIITVLILKQCFVLRSSCEVALKRRPVYPEVSCTP